MRYIIIFILLFLALDAEDKKQKVTIGLGAFYQSQPYKDVDDKVVATPVIFYDNGLVYVRWSRAGIYFLGQKHENYAWGFSLTAQPRVYSYESDEIAGMDEREGTWEGGLAFSATYGDAYLEIMALNDLLAKHKSWLVKTEIGYDIKLGDLSLYPSMIFIYQSSSFLDYYYGVKDSEAVTSSYRAYSPKQGLDIGMQTYIKYPLTKNLATLLNIRADKLTKQATDSPLVDDSIIYSGLASLIYTFKY